LPELKNTDPDRVRAGDEYRTPVVGKVHSTTPAALTAYSSGSLEPKYMVP